MVKAFLLDFDGTIVLSEKSRFWSINKVLESYNVSISDDEWDSHFKRINSTPLFEEIISKYNLDANAEELYKQSSSIRSRYIEKQGLQVSPGFFDFYEKITKLKISCVICTGGTKSHIESSINSAQLPKMPFISREQYDNVKPAPDCYKKGLELLGVKAEDAIVIDDSYNGIKAGIDAGCRVIGINCRDEEGIEELPVERIVDDFRDIDESLMENLLSKNI